MKNRILLFVSSFVFLLSSCLGSDSEYDYDIAKNCQISSFVLKHDSISGLSTTKFTIDQLNNRIFNQDSLPFGTEVEKVVATVSYVSSVSVGSVQVYQEAVGDTIYWNGTDSLDYSKPVKFIITAYDGVTKKIYDTRLNVHQVVPDSMVWTSLSSLPGSDVTARKVLPFRIAEEEVYSMYTQEADGCHLYLSPVVEWPVSWESRTLTGLPNSGVVLDQMTEYEGRLYVPTTTNGLYVSEDGVNWLAAEAAPQVTAVLGVVKEETTTQRASALATIASFDGVSYFASMDKSGVWAQGDPVPAEFPVSGFAPLSYGLMYREHLMLAGGKTSAGTVLSDVWSTMDGVSWALMTSEASFGAREGASVALYDSTFFMIGGFDADGTALKDIYRSKNNGISWALSDTLTVMPEAYSARGYASLVLDEETNYIYLFGGKEKTNTKDVGELWRGRINRLGFKK